MISIFREERCSRAAERKFPYLVVIGLIKRNVKRENKLEYITWW